LRIAGRLLERRSQQLEGLREVFGLKGGRNVCRRGWGNLADGGKSYRQNKSNEDSSHPG
jgi:hypothetical protein